MTRTASPSSTQSSTSRDSRSLPASQDHKKAASVLKKLNVPCMCAVPPVFQSFKECQLSELGCAASVVAGNRWRHRAYHLRRTQGGHQTERPSGRLCEPLPIAQEGEETFEADTWEEVKA